MSKKTIIDCVEKNQLSYNSLDEYFDDKYDEICCWKKIHEVYKNPDHNEECNVGKWNYVFYVDETPKLSVIEMYTSDGKFKYYEILTRNVLYRCYNINKLIDKIENMLQLK